MAYCIDERISLQLLSLEKEGYSSKVSSGKTEYRYSRGTATKSGK